MMSLSESLALKLVSLLLALILWITILGLKREEVKKNVKFEPLLPPGMVLVSTLPSYIQFTLSGPRVLLKDVEKRLSPIRPNLRLTRDTTINISINEDLLGELPPGVKVTGFSPTNVLLRLEEVIEKKLPVKPTLNGTPAAGYEIESVKVTPPKVEISGPKSLLQGLEFIMTELVDVHEIKETKEVDVNIDADPSQGLQMSNRGLVHVKVIIKKNRQGKN